MIITAVSNIFSFDKRMNKKSKEIETNKRLLLACIHCWKTQKDPSWQEKMRPDILQTMSLMSKRTLKKG